MICIIGNELQLISINNYDLGDFVDRIYPIELEIKNTTDKLDLLRILTYTIKLIMADVGQTGVSGEQSRSCLVLIKI